MQKVHRAMSKILQIPGLSLKREELSFQVTFSLILLFQDSRLVLLLRFSKVSMKVLNPHLCQGNWMSEHGASSSAVNK